MKQEQVILEFSGQQATITLNRPDIHNAFDDKIVAQLDLALEQVNANGGCRLLLIRSEGNSFSAGADMNWMRRMAAAGEAENKADALALARLLRKLNELPMATIARVQGAALGGGMGLVACCDVVIAAHEAVFGLTEVHLGLIPAVISPYVINKIGPGQARRLAISGRRINADEAFGLGLVHQCVNADQLDETVTQEISLIMRAAPKAVAEAKKLIAAVNQFDGADPRLEDQLTAAWIARLRVGQEGQEGLQAFLDKRKAAWRSPGT